MSATVQVLRADHVGCVVTDLDAALDWYARHLGLRLRDRWEDAALGMRWAHLEGAGVRVELVERPASTARPDEAAGFHHLALEVDGCAEATAALVAAGGTEVHPPSRFARHRMEWSFVADPFGNVIELVSYGDTAPPRSEEPARVPAHTDRNEAEGAPS